jgi:hypothetical protein
MKYTVEVTQDLFHELQPSFPADGDKRHTQDEKYPFLDYDVLSDGEDSLPCG